MLKKNTIENKTTNKLFINDINFLKKNKHCVKR